MGKHFADLFQKGDVIYGFSKPRNTYFLLIANYSSMIQDGNFATIDEYNNITFGESSLRLDSNNQMKISDNQGRLDPKNLANVQHNMFEYQIDSTMYGSNPAYAKLDNYGKAIEKSGKRNPEVAVDEKMSPEKHKRNDGRQDHFLFRRACKFGLSYVINVLGCRVHFVLDADAVMGAKKIKLEKLQVKPANESYPITYSEIRECFKNRDLWIPTGRLIFYFNGCEVDPPWLGNEHQWIKEIGKLGAPGQPYITQSNTNP